MPNNRVFFYSPGTVNCLKVYNSDGDELSLAGEDERFTRLAIFKDHQMVGGEVFNVTPEELLRNLAGHLGYTVTKK